MGDKNQQGSLMSQTLTPEYSKSIYSKMTLNAETELQQRYTQLLEQRIAQLEVLVNGPPKPPDAPKVDGKTEVKKVEANDKEKATDSVTKDKGTETDKKEGDAKPTTRYRNILRKWDRTAGSHKDEVSPQFLSFWHSTALICYAGCERSSVKESRF